MKGISEEFIYLVVIVLAIFTLLAFLNTQSLLKETETKKTVGLRFLREEGNLAIFSLFNNKVDFVEKPYIETVIDAVLSKHQKNDPTEIYKAFYGIGVGTLNNTEIIPSLFKNYLPGKWKLEVITPNRTVEYGFLSGEPRYVYKQLIPVPEERLGLVILYLG